MKKLTQLALIAIIAVLFTSCKKTYTCTCTRAGVGMDPITSTSIIVTTRSKAESWCKSIQAVQGRGVSRLGESYTCRMK